ncbi:hypothetical protein LEN26_019909 [Aphanomyces euteiches]|nr:hypothetical protein LEN26_019909 [Aphanomyces euteiches]KAH9106850.1 hypothetical protein AeMF1_017629 [Aphanomyces euteiches]KAH9131324.1 hypothetical protein AeNC1_019714 [Aphanomyces euteiches]
MEISPNQPESYNPSRDQGMMDEIREAAASLQKLLAALEIEEKGNHSATCISTCNLRSRVEQLEQQMKDVVEEKDYWKRRCVNYEASFATMVRRTRTNSELKEIANSVTVPKASPPRGTLNGPHFHTDVDPSIPPSAMDKRSSFRLLKCSDEECEVFTPLNRTIQTQCRAKNNVQLMWECPPTTVLLIKKPNEDNVTKSMLQVAKWLMENKHMRVYLEPNVHQDVNLPGTYTWKDTQDWHQKQSEIDFVVTLGGDGTVLWASSLFNRSVPPVLSYAMGSLGFLTPFDVVDYSDSLSKLIAGAFHISLRQRLLCTIIRANLTPQIEPIQMPIHALNEVVVDRGQMAALVELDCYCDGVELTKISADGIIIASPTGSTAYSLSAGGSMTHPSVPCMLFTPICPHTLSFRPLLFHDSARLRIVVPETARTSTVMVSFDGKMRVPMSRGDALEVRVAALVCVRQEQFELEPAQGNQTVQH